MGDTAGQIERRIEQHRDALRENVDALQHKASQAVDWRAQFEQRPMTMIGLAFGGGLLLEAFVRGRRAAPAVASAPATGGAAPSASAPARSHHRSRPGSDTIERLKGALIATAVTRLGATLDEWLPGFQQRFDQSERR